MEKQSAAVDYSRESSREFVNHEPAAGAAVVEDVAVAVNEGLFADNLRVADVVLAVAADADVVAAAEVESSIDYAAGRAAAVARRLRK